ncbi:hypothetical protein [Azospirillum endophyticum]
MNRRGRILGKDTTNRAPRATVKPGCRRFCRVLWCGRNKSGQPGKGSHDTDGLDSGVFFGSS